MFAIDFVDCLFSVVNRRKTFLHTIFTKYKQDDNEKLTLDSINMRFRIPFQPEIFLNFQVLFNKDKF